MQVFTTIFDVLWLLAVLGLLIFIAVQGGRQREKVQDQLIEAIRRNQDLAAQALETTRLVAQRNVDLATRLEAKSVGVVDAVGVEEVGDGGTE